MGEQTPQEADCSERLYVHCSVSACVCARTPLGDLCLYCSAGLVGPRPHLTFCLLKKGEASTFHFKVRRGLQLSLKLGVALAVDPILSFPRQSFGRFGKGGESCPLSAPKCRS